MIRDDRVARISRMVVVAVVLFAGCRSFPLPKPHIEDVAIDRNQRKAVAVERFERHRNHAEFQAALAARDRGDLQGSQDSLTSLLRRAPQHRDARLLLATVELEQGRDREALAQLETAIADFPNDPTVHHAMATLLTELGQTEDALAYDDRAKKLAIQQNAELASNANAALGSNQVMKASFQSQPQQDAHAGQTRDNEAPSALNRSTLVLHNVDANDDGGNNNAMDTSVVGLLSQGEQALARGTLEIALSRFQKAAQLEPHNPHIPTDAAIAALRQNRPDVAVTIAQDALVAFPRWTPLLRTLGMAHYRQGDYQSSQLVLQQALSLDKTDWLAYFLLGCTYAKLDQFDAAEACFADARRINPRLANRNISDVQDSLR